MTPRQPPPGAVSEALVRAGWLGLADRLIGGICHDLNGRAAALGSLVQLLRMEADLEIPAMIEREMRELEGLRRRLQLLMGDADGPSEPLAPGPRVEALCELHSLEHGVEGGTVEVTIVDDPPAVRVNWAAFSRIVLLLLSETRWRNSSAGRLDVTVGTGAGGGLEIGLAPRERTDGEPAGPRGPSFDRRALTEALELMGGRIEERADGGVRLHWSPLTPR